jgi:hypothetical protein
VQDEDGRHYVELRLMARVGFELNTHEDAGGSQANYDLRFSLMALTFSQLGRIPSTKNLRRFQAVPDQIH